MQLNFKKFGEGQPMIILHGLFGMLDNWQTLSRSFAEKYQVFLVDQRNHGKSPHASLIDYQSMADDLHDFLLSHDLSNATILGHSMGGKTAMQFATYYPEMVRKLIVVDIAPKVYKGGHQKIFEALFNVNIEKVSSRMEVEAALAEKIDEPGIRLFLMKNLNRSKGGSYRWKMNLPAIHEHYDKILGNIDKDIHFEGDSLFIRGALSKYIKDEDEATIREYFPNARIVSIPDAGHWVHADAPRALFDEVVRFVGH